MSEAQPTCLEERMPGDVVSIRSTVLEIRDEVLRFLHEMVNDETGQPVARSELTAVHLDRTCGAPVRSPKTFAGARRR